MAINLPEFDYFSLQAVADAFFSTSANGAVMGKLGNYPFFMHENDYKQISHDLTSSFSSYQPIKGLEVVGDSGGTGRSIRLNGVLVAEPLGALKSLEYLLKRREELRFTTQDGDYNVVMTNLNIVESDFYIDGTARVQRYNITLKEVYGEII